MLITLSTLVKREIRNLITLGDLEIKENNNILIVGPMIIGSKFHTFELYLINKFSKSLLSL